MTRETMNAEERVWAAIRFENPDRTPVGPHLHGSAAASLTGRTQAQIAFDHYETHQAELEVFDKFGGWDFMYMPMPSPGAIVPTLGMKVKLPGRDLPDDVPYQVIEEEVMTVEDYDAVIEGGWNDFLMSELLHRVEDDDRVFEALGDRFQIIGEVFENWGKRDVFYSDGSLVGGNHPFFSLSLARSMTKFTEDLYYRPGLVKRALDKMVEEAIETFLERASYRKTRVAVLIEERASGYFFPLRIFDEFWWGYTRQIVDALWSEGMTTVFHLDTSWDRNIHYFKELPKYSAVLHFDSTTNIFTAMDALQDHLCVMGDLSASLLSIGQPEEVEAYVKRLIDKADPRGGLIVSSGCDVPVNVKPENLQAMLDTAKSYRARR